MSTPQEQLEEITTALTQVQITHYANLAGVLIILYDYILCFKYEVRYIWHGRWNMGKVLYICMRYIPTIEMPFNIAVNLWGSPLPFNFCVRWLWVDSLTAWFSLSTVVFLLSLRTVALYTRAKIPSILTCAVGAGTVITVAVLFIVQMLEIGPIITVSMTNYGLNNLLTGCLWTSHSQPTPNILSFKYFVYVWESHIGFEVWVCAMTFLKAILHLRSQQSHLKFTPLLLALYTDGFLYSFLILFVATTNLILWTSASSTLSTLVINVYRACLCVMGCRIILTLRHVGGRANMVPGVEEVDVSMGLRVVRTADGYDEDGLGAPRDDIPLFTLHSGIWDPLRFPDPTATRTQTGTNMGTIGHGPPMEIDLTLGDCYSEFRSETATASGSGYRTATASEKTGRYENGDV